MGTLARKTRSLVHSRIRVTVVGGGVIGCAVAYELGRRGLEVRVLERRGVGLGATQASAGMLAPFIEAEHAGPLRRLGSRSLELYDQFVADVVGASGDSVPYDRCGTIEVATDSVTLARLERSASELTMAGVGCRLVGGSEAVDDEPHLSRHVAGALLVPSHGFVGAAPLTAALRRAAARHGAHADRHDACRARAGAVRVGSLPTTTIRIHAEDSLRHDPRSVPECHDRLEHRARSRGVFRARLGP